MTLFGSAGIRDAGVGLDAAAARPIGRIVGPLPTGTVARKLYQEDCDVSVPHGTVRHCDT